MKQFLIQLLFLSQIFGFGHSSSWIISCKPCTSQLDYCLSHKFYLLDDDFINCIESITYSSCQNCVLSIKRSEQIWCEQTLDYHRLVCTVHCRLKGLDKQGYCDFFTGLCVC